MKDLEKFIKNLILKDANKLKGKFQPLSEIIDKIPRTYKIKKIYNLSGKLKDYFLIIINNYAKEPKRKYYLAYKLANQSSDLLVNLAKSFASENQLNLIQYSIYPQLIGRISLLCFREIENEPDYYKIMELFELFRNNFRKKMVNLKNLVEDK
ncbi:MAG: hypothetical protein ACTSR8_03425 [Promethearchaeota archaeon]